MRSIKIEEGENIYTTPSPDYEYSRKYICVNCGFTGSKRDVLDHTCIERNKLKN